MPIKELLFEQQDLEEGDLEEIANYPKGFSLETLKSLPSFNKKVKYSQEHLAKIGAGSSRVVFLADDNTVIKLAKNAKGLAQNELEIDVSRFYDQEGHATAKVFDFDKDGLWVEMERARKAKTSDFVREFGMPFLNFGRNLIVAKRMSDGYTLQGMKAIDENLRKNETFITLQSLIADYEMSVGDILRISSWGVVNRNGKDKLILVDFGLDKQVFKDFYARMP